MNIKAKYTGSRNEGDSLVIEFTLENWVFRRFEEQLKQGEEYVIDIKKPAKNRSLGQNKLLWELLTEIDEKVNGTRNPWQWYVSAIRNTGVKTKVIYMNEDSLDELKQMCLDRNGNIRAVEALGRIEDLYAYRIYFGSSKFDTKEMSLLIDTVLDMAQIVGIDKLYWEELLK